MFANFLVAAQLTASQERVNPVDLVAYEEWSLLGCYIVWIL
jgi:hypothetical protein